MIIKIKWLFLLWGMAHCYSALAQNKDSTWTIQVQLIELPSYTCGLTCGDLAMAGVYAFEVIEGLQDSLEGQTVLIVIPCQTCLDTTAIYTLEVTLHQKKEHGIYLIWSDYPYPEDEPVFWSKSYSPKKKIGRNRRKRKKCCDRKSSTEAIPIEKTAW